MFEWGEICIMHPHKRSLHKYIYTLYVYVKFRELEHVLLILIVSDVVAKPDSCEIYSKSRVKYNCWKLSGFIL